LVLKELDLASLVTLPDESARVMADVSEVEDVTEVEDALSRLVSPAANDERS
jgi:hypothetical protein